jgi:hypothetical protein
MCFSLKEMLETGVIGEVMIGRGFAEDKPTELATIRISKS